MSMILMPKVRQQWGENFKEQYKILKSNTNLMIRIYVIEPLLIWSRKIMQTFRNDPQSLETIRQVIFGHKEGWIILQNKQRERQKTLKYENVRHKENQAPFDNILKTIDKHAWTNLYVKDWEKQHS